MWFHKHRSAPVALVLAQSTAASSGARGERGFVGLPKPKLHPQLHPTVPVRKLLLIRRISKKIKEWD